MTPHEREMLAFIYRETQEAAARRAARRQTAQAVGWLLCLLLLAAGVGALLWLRTR